MDRRQEEKEIGEEVGDEEEEVEGKAEEEGEEKRSYRGVPFIIFLHHFDVMNSFFVNSSFGHSRVQAVHNSLFFHQIVTMSHINLRENENL